MLARLQAALASRYRVERELGAGGMATVYLAHDLRHDRDVAIKVMRPELAAAIGADRFLHEITTTANLQHPHIVALFDSGPVDGTVFYVTPYLEGKSLRDRLVREKQLPIETAIRIGVEVASALDYAHRHGVIHRDIKPENILFHDGQALVADFGIALATSGGRAGRLTATGVSLGTPSYMSPEQATGERQIDSRADIYALGCVLYEMLTGEPPFSGATAQAVLARALTEEPRPPSLLRKTIPPSLEQAILTALAKLPADRFETAAQFGAALAEKRASTPSDGFTTPGARIPVGAVGGRRRSRLLAGGALAAAVLVGAAGTWAWLQPKGGDAPEPVRFVLTFPPEVRLLQGQGAPLVLSPDGRTLVYRTQAAGSSMLYLRAFDQLVPTAIAGTERAALPFISPDGRWVGYFTGTELRKIPLDGGPPATVAAVKLPHGASWGPGDLIVLGAYPGSDGLSRVSSADGAVQPFAVPDTASGELSQRWPRVLADGKTVLYTSWGNGGLMSARIGIASLETGKGTILPVPGSYPLGVVDGRLLFARADGALMAVSIDLSGPRVSGEAVTLVDGVAIEPTGASDAAVSESGVLAYLTGSAASRLVMVGEGGVVRPLVPERREYEGPRLSPDGRRIAVAIDARPSDVWVYDIAAGTLSRLTSEADNLRPEWSPDGRRIAFLSNRSGEIAVWWSDADGSTPLQKVFESPDDATEVAVSADGGVLLYRANQSGGSYGSRYASLDDQSTPRPFFSTPSYHEFMPSLSPDGRWLAYVSDESGAPAVYVRPFPGPAARYLVSADGGSEPRWSPDGRRLFYRNGRKMLAATVSTTPGFAVTGRAALFEGSYAAGASHRNYDVSGDGREFLLLQRDADPEVVVVLNWLTELGRRGGQDASK